MTSSQKWCHKKDRNVTTMTSSTQNYFLKILVNTNLYAKFGGPMTNGLGVKCGDISLLRPAL